MLNLLRHLLDKKSALPNRQKDQPTESSNESPCSLEIQMNIDGTVNIICSWPEFDETNKKIMTHLANHYAMMIDALNSGFLAKDIVETLKNHQTENPMDTLFAQNVFYKIAEINFLKNHQNNSNQDVLVKPSQVFNKPS